MNSGILRAGEGRSAWVVGDLYTVKASGEDTGGAFALIEVRVPPGWGPPPHIHRREDEAFCILDADITLRCGERRSRSAPRGHPEAVMPAERAGGGWHRRWDTTLVAIKGDLA